MSAIPTKEKLQKFREEFNDKGKDQIRHQVVDNIKSVQLIQPTNFDLTFSGSGSYDAKEFTEELFKVLRNGQDSPEDMNKDTIEKCYGGSITQMITFLKDYKKIKENLEKSEKAMVKGIDALIEAMNKAENACIKDSKANSGNTESNEGAVQFSSVFQSVWGFIKETQTQAFSAVLQAVKDACIQAKNIAVKIVGLNKKMTEESYDYGNYYNASASNSPIDFISSTKLI